MVWYFICIKYVLINRMYLAVSFQNTLALLIRVLYYANEILLLHGAIVFLVGF